MKGLTYYLVDVFAQERYAGNQLAVVTGAFFLPEERMQAIANEMHFSETTFIPSSEKRNGGFNVRIFTPSIEVPFAGHPTLGTAYVIKHFIQGEDGDGTVRKTRSRRGALDEAASFNFRESLQGRGVSKCSAA
jgi:trans-2,3-dihydro-3-hydroxyanthranilate isomerase